MYYNEVIIDGRLILDDIGYLVLHNVTHREIYLSYATHTIILSNSWQHYIQNRTTKRVDFLGNKYDYHFHDAPFH